MIYANQVGKIIERRHVWSALVQILRDHADRVVDQAHVPEQNGVWERRCSSHGISECASEGLEMGELAHVSCRLLNQCSFSLADFSVVLGRAFGDLVVPKHACVLTKLMQQTSHPGLAEEASGDHRPPAHPLLCFISRHKPLCNERACTCSTRVCSLHTETKPVRSVQCSCRPCCRAHVWDRASVGRR